jgi:hypothetical protein
MSATKVRGAAVDNFGATFSFVNDSAHELVEARFWPHDPAMEEQDERAATEANIISELKIIGQPMSPNQVYDRVGGNRAETLDIIRQMVKFGKVGQKQGTRGMLIYALPDKGTNR